jgi:hypothetical protein
MAVEQSLLVTEMKHFALLLFPQILSKGFLQINTAFHVVIGSTISSAGIKPF